VVHAAHLDRVPCNFWLLFSLRLLLD